MTIVKCDSAPYSVIIGGNAVIVYDRFWETLKSRGESTYTLITRYQISSATIDRIRKGQGITTAKLDDLCNILHCRVEDIITHIPDQP